MTKITTIAAAIAACAISTTAHAAIVINITESGSDTTATFTGSFDLGALNGLSGVGFNANFMFPLLNGNGYIALLPGNVDYYFVSNQPVAFGINSNISVTFSNIIGQGIALFSDPAIGFPQGYMSGDPINGTGTITGFSLAGLGLVSGTSFVNTYTNGMISDTVTINVGPTSVIPEPSTYIAAAGLLGLAGFVFIRRQRKNAAAAV